MNAPELAPNPGEDVAPARVARSAIGEADALELWTPAFESFVARFGLQFVANSSEEAATSATDAARFIISLLQNEPQLRKRFPHALADGTKGRFFRWLNGGGGRRLRLSPAALAQITEVFQAPPSDPIFRLYLNEPELQRAFPFALLAGRQGSFSEWLATQGRAVAQLTAEQILWFLLVSAEQVERGLWLTYLLTPAWQREFPLALTSSGWRSFRNWAASNVLPSGTRARFGRPPPFLSRFERRSLARRCASPPPPQGERTTLGINILGHFCYPSGLREAALSTKASLERCGARTSCRDVPVGSAQLLGDRAGWLGLEVYPVTLLTHAPTPFFATTYERSGLLRREAVYRIAYWYWELDKIPDEWLQLVPLIDEIWSPTEFVAAAMRARMPLPVYKMPPGVEIGAVEQMSRSTVGVPDDHCLFLFMFDVNSQLQRKNPEAVIAAFKLAFRRDDKASLLIKTTSSGTLPPELRQLEQSASGANIVFMHQLLSRAATHGVVETCDCFVSLHRSEGFGLGLAEAMLLGKPVIATNYSGNLEFMNADNSLLVDYRIEEITEDGPIYSRGNRWAEPSVEHAASHMRTVFSERGAAARLGARAKADMLRDFSLRNAGERKVRRIRELGIT